MMKEEIQFLEANEFEGVRVNTVGLCWNYSAEEYMKEWNTVRLKNGELKSNATPQKIMEQVICYLIRKHFDKLVQIKTYSTDLKEVTVIATMNVLAPETNVRRLTYYSGNDNAKVLEVLEKAKTAKSGKGEDDVLGNN